MSIDQATAGRVNAVAVDVMSGFRHVVELYWHTPQLVEAAGFEKFEHWVAAQPKPQLTAGERRVLAAEYTVELGMTQREAAAALGVDHSTVSRMLGANAPDDEADHAGDKPINGANAPDDDPAVAPPSNKRKEKLFPRSNVTDVRKLTEGILMSLTQLGPEDVIRPAFPLMRDFVQALIQWAGENWPANGDNPDA